MNLLHVALACSSEENADKFYRGLLGLEKAGPKVLPSSLALEIFGIESDFTLINYMDESIHFEVFIKSGDASPGMTKKELIDGRPPIDHVCLAVEDLRLFLEKCSADGISVTRVPKGDTVVTFISDYDGNLFEIKQM